MKTWATILHAAVGFGLLWWAVLAEVQANPLARTPSLDERFQELVERFEPTVRRTQAESRARVERRERQLARGEDVASRARTFCDLHERSGHLPKAQRQILAYHCVALADEAEAIVAELQEAE